MTEASTSAATAAEAGQAGGQGGGGLRPGEGGGGGLRPGEGGGSGPSGPGVGIARPAAVETTPRAEQGVTTVALSRPIPVGAGELAALTLRAPNAGMLRGIKLIEIHELKAEAILALAARCSSPHVTEAQLAALKPADLLRLAEAVTGFFAD